MSPGELVDQYRSKEAILRRGQGSDRSVRWDRSVYKSERDDRLARRHRDVLLAIECVCHRRGLPQTVGRKLPQSLAGPRVGRCKSAAVVAEEYQSACSTEHATPRLS